jgi:hypothetical protein
MRSTLRILAMVVFSLLAAAPASAQLVISELRLRGTSGLNDEYVEIMNNSASPHTVAATSGTGYGIAASDGVVRCAIPNGTVIPPRGHYLCVNSTAYSLGSYPAGNGTTATGNATFTTEIGDNVGVALFSTTVPANFSLATRLDALGSTAASSLYREGVGHPAISPFSVDYAWVRDQCGKRGSPTAFGPCPLAGAVVDTNDNAVDFFIFDTNGTPFPDPIQLLGAPGPQNLSSPLVGTASMPATVLDACVPAGAPPNTVRDFTPLPGATFGTIQFRTTITNNTGQSITRLRYRVIDITTFPVPTGIADLRPRTSTTVVVTVDRRPCGSGTSNVSVGGTTLEQPPSQLNGGGFNSSLSSGTVTLDTPLANGASIDVRFLLGIEQNGDYRFSVLLETLPIGVGTFIEYGGHTLNGGTTMSVRPPLSARRDFNLDGKADLLWRNTSTGATSIWLMNGTAFLASGSPGNPPTSFAVAGVGDFNRDGKADLLWRNTGSGEVFLWLMNGVAATASGSLGVVDTDWTVEGVADFDGDGRADILWRNATGAVFLWFMNGLTVTGSASLGPVGLDWAVEGVGDVNGDHRADIVWRNTGSGAVFVWLLAGASVVGSGALGAVGPEWTVVGVGDFNADGRADILWRHAGTGQVFIWLLNGLGVITSGSPGGAGNDWTLARVSDFNGDGKDDLVWRHTSGLTHIWLLNGTGFVASGALGTVGTEWALQ